MRELTILENVAHRALLRVPDDVAADFNEADRALDTVRPRHLLAGLESAAEALAEQIFLDIYDGYTSGTIGPDFDFNAHNDLILTAFYTRVTMTLRFVPSTPLGWLPECERTIIDAYVERVRRLGMGLRGGFA